MSAVISIQPLLCALGAKAMRPIGYMGHVALFLLQGVTHMVTYPLQFRKILEQMHIIGAKSIFVIALTGAFTGMVLGLQGYYTLVLFGSEEWLGSGVALSMIREMGPVLTAIMVIGRAGSAMAAEIGIMRISEQIDALETMDINPIRFLVSPRIAACLLSFPLLTAIFDTIGIFGGYLTGSVLLGINPGSFFYWMESSVDMHDINGGFLKSIVFALVVAVICCYQGFYTHHQKEGFGAKGVSQSTTRAVVISCVLILITDYVLTSFLL